MEMDNRGLEAPEPLLRILDGLDQLPPDDDLVAWLDREPCLLYPFLEERGLHWEIEELPEGYRLRVTRAAA